MPGGRLRSFRLGDRAELLVGHLLTGVAFTTPVPRQEDIGVDFMCSLIRSDNENAGFLKGGPIFFVQSKGSTEDWVFEKPHELEWIKNQENPILLCIADREAGAMDVYSTWNLLCGVLNGWKGQKSANCIRLCPGKSGSQWFGVEDREDGSQDILLGKPIIRITHDEIFDEESTKRISKVIGQWISIDRENIVNRQAGLYWVIGPLSYETGNPLGGPHGGFLYWNPNNLEKCHVNLGRSATALWRVLQTLPEQSAQEPWKTGVRHLKELLRWLGQVDPNLGLFIGNLDE
jgi:hypothetical protein